MGRKEETKGAEERESQATVRGGRKRNGRKETTRKGNRRLGWGGRKEVGKWRRKEVSDEQVCMGKKEGGGERESRGLERGRMCINEEGEMC